MSGSEKISLESTSLETELDRLRRRESLLKAAERIANIGHWEWDYLKNRLVSCSEGFARIYNQSVAEILESQNTWEHMLAQIHPDDRENYISIYKSQPESTEHEVEYRIVLANGQIRYVKESGIVQFGDDNRAVSAFGLLQDITDRVVYEKELENRDALASQVEAITDIGHFIFNLQKENYHYVSEGFARIHGLPCLSELLLWLRSSLRR